MGASREVPTKLGRYRLEEVIGRGGMGTVYRARDEETGTLVAVKVLLAELAENLEYLKRFRREIRSAERLTSSHVVRILGSGEEAGHFFFAMELLVDARDLAQVVHDEGAMTPQRSLDVALQLCAALTELHATGVVHRDIKPGNLMVLPDGQVKLMDFGLAKMMDLTALTATGEALGSPRYMSPEILRGQPADYRSDVYQVGVLLYELLAGVPAFDGESFDHLMHLILETEAPDLSSRRPELSADLVSVVRTCLRKNPNDRYRTIDELAANLEAVRDGRPPLPPFSGKTSGRHTGATGRTRGSASVSPPSEVSFRPSALLPLVSRRVLVGLLALAVAVLVVALVLRIEPTPVDPRVTVGVGFRTVRLTWVTASAGPTTVRIRAGDGPVRQYTNTREAEVTEHTILVPGLDGGGRYRAQLPGTRGPDHRPVVVEFDVPNPAPPSSVRVERDGSRLRVSAAFDLEVTAALEGRLQKQALATPPPVAATPSRLVDARLGPVPPYADVDQIRLILTDRFGESRSYPLEDNPGSAELLLRTAPGTAEAGEAVRRLVGHSPAFFADPGESHERKVAVYRRLLDAGASPGAWAPFVEWRSPRPEDGLTPRRVDVSGPPLPCEIEPVPRGAALRGVGVVFIIRLDEEPPREGRVALQLSRGPLPQGATMAVVLNDGFEMTDEAAGRPAPDRAVLLPAGVMRRGLNTLRVALVGGGAGERLRLEGILLLTP